jgi:NADH:ubiquinone oxidoreductase subunit H
MLASLTVILFYVFCALLKVVFLLIAIAYFTLAERKVMGSIHRRRGPNTEGFWGVLQPLFDGAKLILKELNSRTFQLRDFISWERFIQGN